MNMSDRPKVSIVLVNYNGARDTLECIDSLSNITYPNYQIIVVDNASSDDSVSIMSQGGFPNMTLLEAGDNLGFSGGNNVGIRYALEKGTDYILLLNNDTIVTEDFLDKLVDSAKILENQAVITSKILYAGEPDTIWYAGGEFNEKTGRVSHTHIGQKNDRQEQLREVTFISGCCMLFSVDTFSRIGELEESFFLYCEDLEYCCRAREKGVRLYYEPRSVIYHKVSASTGKASTLSVYYTVRNTQNIIESYVLPQCRIVAKLYFVLQTVKRIVSGEYSWKAVKKGLLDYQKKVTGKAAIN